MASYRFSKHNNDMMWLAQADYQPDCRSVPLYSFLK